MTWSVLWSEKHISDLEKIAMATGRLPLALLNRPEEPDEILTQYLKAYLLLDSSRNQAGGIGFESVAAYADKLGDDPFELATIIKHVDMAMNEARKQKEEPL